MRKFSSIQHIRNQLAFLFSALGGERKWEILTEEDLEEVLVVAETVAQEEILDQERCIKQLALNADRNAKFLSSRKKAGQFSAENATQRKELFNSLK